MRIVFKKCLYATKTDQDKKLWSQKVEILDGKIREINSTELGRIDDILKLDD